jgi:Transposase
MSCPHGLSGAKSDAGDAHILADIVRTDRHQLGPISGDSAQAEAVKVLPGAKTLWNTTRHVSKDVNRRPGLWPSVVTQLASGISLVTPVLGVKIGVVARRRRVTLVFEAVS